MAAGSTYTPIATYTVAGSAASSITFNSIPSTYTDLVLVCNVQATAGGSGLVVPNGASSFSFTRVYGNGTSALSSRGTSFPGLFIGSVSSGVIGTYIMHLMNYSNTTTYKTTLARSSASDTDTEAIVSLWQSTSAISSLVFSINGTTIAVGGTATLYGIAAA